MSKVNNILSMIQSELKVPKNKKNTFGGYFFRDLSGIFENVKPLLSKYKAVLTVNDDVMAVNDRVYVKATATITSIEDESQISVSAYAREDISKKGMDLSQLTGACSSYARKYALNGLFCIDDTKDADAMDNRDDEPKQAPTTRVRRSRKKNAVDECPF